MDTSQFIAQLIGPGMVILGVSIFANREYVVKTAQEVLNSNAHLFMAGLLALSLGLALVNTHNIWSGGWPVLITVLGWASLFSGIVRLLFPKTIRTFGEKMINCQFALPVSGGVYTGIGILLSYFGYFN